MEITVVHECGVQMYNGEINVIWDGSEDFTDIEEFVEGFVGEWDNGNHLVWNKSNYKKVDMSHVLVTVSYNESEPYDNMTNEEHLFMVKFRGFNNCFKTNFIQMLSLGFKTLEYV